MQSKIMIIFLIFLIFYNAILNFLGLSNVLGYLDEFIEIAVIIYGVVVAISKRKLMVEKELLITYLCLIIVVILGLLGNVLFNYMPNYSAVLRDLVQFLKFPLIVIILEQTKFWEKIFKKYDLNYFIRILKCLIILVTFLGIISIFKDIGLSQNEIRNGIKPYQFLFSHPTYLVLSGIYMLAIINSYNNNSKLSKYEIMLLFLIFLTMRTKGFVIIAIFLFAKYMYRYLVKFKILFFIILVLIGLFVAKDKLELYSSFSNSPREALYRGAIQLSTDGFPVGSGFGTFASYISGKYHSKVYDYIYVPHSEEVGASISVLGDAGIPYYLGQLGMIGAILFAYTLYRIFKHQFLNIENKIPMILLISYIVVAFTSETILVNSGMEFAFIITFVRYLNLHITDVEEKQINETD